MTPARYTPDEIARMAHVLNCELQRIQGDPAPAPPWDAAPAYMRGTLAETVRRLGEEKASGMPPSARRAHQLWCEQMRLAGWREGPAKDPAERTHPCLVGWEALPERQRDKDEVTTMLVERFG